VGIWPPWALDGYQSENGHTKALPMMEAPSQPEASSKESLESANLYDNDINNLQYPFPLSGPLRCQALVTLG
jgi:hypothetical protein